MQPNDQEQQWQQPNATPTGAPYAMPPAEQPQPIPTQPAPTPVQPAPTPVQPAPVQQPTPTFTPQAAPEQPFPATDGIGPETAQSAPEQPSTAPVDTTEAVTDTPDDTPALPEQDAEQDDTGDDEPLIRWQSPEYVQRDRSFVWYVVLGIVTIVLTAIALLWMKTITFAILVPVMAVALVVYTRRPPNMVNYTLSKKGLYVNDKLHPYAEFKAFSVLSHAGSHSFQLIPRKRFQLGQTAYFTDDMGESIVDMLAARLPMKDDKPDMYDRISSKLKM